MLTNKSDKALEYLLGADKKEEDIFEVVLQTGRLHLEMGKPEEGKKFLEKAVRLNPDSGPALRYLGECYAAMNLTVPSNVWIISSITVVILLHRMLDELELTVLSSSHQHHGSGLLTLTKLDRGSRTEGGGGSRLILLFPPGPGQLEP